MKRDLPSKKKSEITYEILAYLVDHPDSGDTLEGIVEWWLLERRIEHQSVKVKEVLAELVAKGLVRENKGRDSRVRYRINRRRQGEIQALLRQGMDGMRRGSTKYPKSRS